MTWLITQHNFQPSTGRLHLFLFFYFICSLSVESQISLNLLDCRTKCIFSLRSTQTEHAPQNFYPTLIHNRMNPCCQPAFKSAVLFFKLFLFSYFGARQRKRLIKICPKIVQQQTTGSGDVLMDGSKGGAELGLFGRGLGSKHIRVFYLGLMWKVFL